MTLELHYGGAVGGGQRFPRPELEDRFMRTFDHSAGVKMFGLRRIGKSTLRRYATERFEAAGRPFISTDGQGLHSLVDLLGRLAQAMPREDGLMKRALRLATTGPARAALEALSTGGAYEEMVLSAQWLLVSDAIREALKGDGPKPVLVIDEFTYLLRNMIERHEEQGRNDADRLLASMREWRGEGMPMLLAGSIGLTRLVRTHNLNREHLNDLQPFAVPELTEDEAREFIRLATETPSEWRWRAGHTEEFLQQSGVLYPCFLVRGLLEIDVTNPANPSEFDAIFSERVRPDLHADFYNQFNERFKAYAGLPNDERNSLILPAIKAVMEAEPACPHDDIPCDDPFTQVELALALEMLVEDGFVHFTEDAGGERLWKPASRLAKLWWTRSRLT